VYEAILSQSGRGQLWSTAIEHRHGSRVSAYVGADRFRARQCPIQRQPRGAGTRTHESRHAPRRSGARCKHHRGEIERRSDDVRARAEMSQSRRSAPRRRRRLAELLPKVWIVPTSRYSKCASLRASTGVSRHCIAENVKARSRCERNWSGHERTVAEGVDTRPPPTGPSCVRSAVRGACCTNRASMRAG
jgi:hypothetical protein